jgi:glucokinase
MSERTIAVADVGGTHARFALCRIAGGKVSWLGEPVTLKTADYASFQTACEGFSKIVGEDLPNEMSMAFAGRVDGEVLKLTNNPWVIRPALMSAKLGIDRNLVINDFGAIANAVASLGGQDFAHLCGPSKPLPESGMITVLGPGTGLGVAQLYLRNGGYDVIETEGGHIDFAPLDILEDKILSHLRASYRRVSVERLVSGRGLVNIMEALASIEGRTLPQRDEKELWKAALEGTDSLAAAALDHFCLTLGSLAGDLALAHGSTAVVIGGGLGFRLANHLPRSGFRNRFVAKGRFESWMDKIPVKLITHPQPGLYGAGAAFAKAYP